MKYKTNLARDFIYRVRQKINHVSGSILEGLILQSIQLRLIWSLHQQ